MIPLIIQIVNPDGTVVTFDPTALNSCDGDVSTENRFKKSPLVVATLRLTGEL